jgi:hypothetical protein
MRAELKQDDIDDGTATMVWLIEQCGAVRTADGWIMSRDAVENLSATLQGFASKTTGDASGGDHA